MARVSPVERAQGIAEHLADCFGVYCEHAHIGDHDDDAVCRVDWTAGMTRSVLTFFREVSGG